MSSNAVGTFLATNDRWISLLIENQFLIFISLLGGIVLFGFKLVEHFNRKPGDKMGHASYAGVFIFLLVTLPSLGALMTSIYIANGDKISPLLAFQVGLTSPAIAQSFMIVAANNIANKPEPVAPDQ